MCARCGRVMGGPTHPLMKICADMLDAWWSLADELMLKHAQPAAPGVGVGVNYPSWWLDAVGYPDGPPPVDSPKHAEAQKTVLVSAADESRLAGCIRSCPEEVNAFKACTFDCIRGH